MLAFALALIGAALMGVGLAQPRSVALLWVTGAILLIVAWGRLQVITLNRQEDQNAR